MVTLRPDGALVVPVAAKLPNGARADGVKVVQPGDPEYLRWLPFVQR